MLSPKNVKDYFLKHNPQFSNDSVSVDFVDLGNINYVYKISTPKRIFYLKHGLKHERKKTIFTDYFGLRKNRLKKEVSFIKFLNRGLPSFCGVFPDPIYFNLKENVFIMGDVSEGRMLLKNDLEKGIIDTQILKVLAKFISEQHQLNIKGLNDDHFFRNLLAFRTFLSANKLPERNKQEIKKRYRIIIEEGSRSILNGDFSPKNIFYKKNEFGICDLEFCCLGDPLYDVGFFLAHYHLLKLFKPQFTKKIDRAIYSFIKTYSVHSHVPIDYARLNFYIGTGILNRIDAVPRERYMNTLKIPAARKYAQRLVSSQKEEAG